MRIQHNIAALNSYRQLNSNNSAVAKNLEKLSSGYKINRAGDDAAGLAISEKMRAQITGLETAQSNAQDGISLIQTAEGNLQEVHSMLNRMVELSTQAANGTYDNDVDRANLQKEVNSLNSEIDRIAKSANFNGIKLLDGSIGESKGVGTSSEAAVAGDPLANAAGALANTAQGVLTKGINAVAAEDYFYMPDNIEISAGESLDFKLEFDDGAGKKAEINVKLNNTGAASKTYTLNDIKEVLNGTATPADITAGFAAGTSTVYASIADVRADYDFNFENNKLSATAKHAGAGYGATLSGVVFSEALDKTAAENDLSNKLGGAGAATNIAVGAVTSDGVQGSNAVAGTYQVASTDIALNVLPGNMHGSALKVGDMTYIMKDVNTALDDDIQALAGPNVKIVEFDKTKTMAAKDNMSANVALTNAINRDMGTNHIQAKLDAGGTTLTLSETEAYGNQIIAAKDESMITDMTKAVGKSDLQTGAKGMRSKIDISNDLEMGTQITIGKKTYQFLNDPKDAVDGKVGIQFKAGDSAANAQALMDAIKANDATQTDVALSNDGNSVILTDDKAEISSSSKGLALQVGDTSDSYQQVSVVVKSTSTKSLGIDNIDISNQDGAESALDKIKAAINSVSSTRGDLGAVQNRLEHTINNLSVTTENMTAAESRIRDTDMAKEMMKFSKNNILVQASQAMLAQANQLPQGVLQLLQ